MSLVALRDLIERRRQLLCGLPEHPEWARDEAEVAHVLRSECDPEKLEFRRIDLHTSTTVLDSIVKHEAVHAIADRRSLTRRLLPDRRCFAFFHPNLPTEPLAFTEVALTQSLAARVQPLLDPAAPLVDPALCGWAMFYSITSCHEGLRGIPLGYTLIRRSVEALREESSTLHTFATVSPVPGFGAWLSDTAITGNPARSAQASTLTAPGWMRKATTSHDLARTAVSLCAYYLLHAKRARDPLDPVARFHLGNGARLVRLNWMGDVSDAGLERSAGFTANYLYSLRDLDRNQQAYRAERRVVASRWVAARAGGQVDQ